MVNWKEMLRGSFEYEYAVAEKLMDMVSDDELNWKPATGTNWMTVGQVLHHMTNACGFCVKGFCTGDWGMPADFDPSKASEEDMLPPAEKMPTVTSVAEAKKLLAEDKKLAFEMLDANPEERFATEIAKAPWDQMECKLGERCMQMSNHLMQHKGQLFYYLKLMGKPVNTMHLWGA
ncbi:MAG: DinB family protein [bacterium]|nr:DinB family protein [bacterium]